MALNKAVLKNRLAQILSNPKTKNNVNAVASELADAIDEYVKTGSVVGVDSHGDSHNLIIE
ncbi:hypothetical protein [Tenacibaculum maritimum]|uniref:hypothetical protein n=1 Tax=Tenacibaculum maritimum TaxID=107401 RepID=UPI0012E47ECF|nr:hypothetical protein [Tenacibaculum maritimum]CAA0253592.1 conserved hypothetical protein [Tenacibaculum maritimum]